MMTKKLFAFDLDGTLLSYDKTLPSHTKQILNQLRQQGHVIVIVSGRPIHSIMRIFENVHFDYAVCNNGHSLHDHTGKLLSEEKPLDASDIQTLFTYLHKLPLNIFFTHDNDFCCVSSTHYRLLTKLYLRFYQTIQHLHHNPVTWKYVSVKDNCIASLEKICFAGLHRHLKKLQANIDQSTYNACFVNRNWLEVMPVSTSKGKGLQKLTRLIDIKKENCFVFGDGENDLSMFETFPNSIAVNNAMPILKKHAKHITKSVYEEGVAYWLETHILTDKENR